MPKSAVAAALILLLAANGFAAGKPPESNLRGIVAVQSCTPLPHDTQRVALVIGNAQYKSSPRLPNAANDARSVKDVLERCLGFTVILALDQSRTGLIDRVREFGERMVPGGIALFYYAGHGVEQNGKNYLVPVVHNIRSRADIAVEGYPIDDLINRMEARTGEAGVNIVIVDACRNNPLPELPAAGRDFGWRSLAPVDAQSGTLIMHSTRSGMQALDDTPGAPGGNSPFTAALVRQIVRPELTLRDLPYEVTADVRQLTNRLQEPWASASYVPPLRLAAGAVSATAPLASVGGARASVSPPAVSPQPAPPPPTRTIRGKMVDLGNLPGAIITEAHELNDRAEVIGVSSPAGGEPRAFLWTRTGGMRKFEAPGQTSIYPTGINAKGAIVGVSDDTSHGRHAFFWSAGLGMRVLLTAQNEKSLGDVDTRVWRISGNGNVAGFGILASRSEEERSTPNRSIAFMAEDEGLGTLHRIGTLGGRYSMAQDVNDLGQVAGWSLDKSAGRRAFLWTRASGLRDLGTLGGSTAESLAINARGDVVGKSTNSSGATRAFLWTAQGGMRDLGTLGGASAVAFDVNDSGQVVGTAQNAAGHDRAFLWTPETGMVDLGSLGGAVSVGAAINNRGEIVGGSDDDKGRERAFFWSPRD